MPTAKVIISGAVGPEVVNTITRPKRVVLKQVEGRLRSFSFPIGPLQVQYGDLGIEYVNIERPGDRALLESTSIKNRTLGIEVVVADPKTAGLTSVESQLQVLESIANEDSDLSFVYGVRSLPYKLRITSLSYDSVRRDINGNITQAAVNMTLTERPRRIVDPITLNAVRYTPTKKAASDTKKSTKGSSKPKPKSNSTDPDRHIHVSDPVSIRVIGGGGGVVRQF